MKSISFIKAAGPFPKMKESSLSLVFSNVKSVERSKEHNDIYTEESCIKLKIMYVVCRWLLTTVAMM